MTSARESVDQITESVAFQKAREAYWMTAPSTPVTRRAEELKSLRIFTNAEIADESAAGHRLILAELERVAARIEEWRVTRSWHYSEPERVFILSLLARERTLLDLAEIVEAQ